MGAVSPHLVQIVVDAPREPLPLRRKRISGKADFPSIGVPWLMEGLGAIYAKARVADRLPAIANVTISNVPGPTIPLYMAGARMLTNYPTSIVVHGVALNITVQTYNESLEFGLIACGEAMPEVMQPWPLACAFGTQSRLP